MALLKDILIVDDEYDIVNVLQIILRKEGFRVHGFTDPLLALDYFKTDPKKFGLIITDVRMPGMDGIELLGKVKKICSDVKAFVVTAADIDTVKHDIKRHALDIEEIVQKPFSLKELAKSVRRHTHISGAR